MRVCMISSEYPPNGYGVGRHVASLARELVAQDTMVQVVTRGKREFTDERGVRVVGLPCPPVYPFHVLAHSAAVNAWLDKNAGSIDMIHAHSPLVGPPRSRLPVVATSHGSARMGVEALGITDLLSLATKLARPLITYLDETTLARAASVIAFSPALAAALADCGIDPTRINVIPNGVDTDFFQPDRGRSGNDKDFRILYVGRLVSQKGILDLAEALKLLAARNIPYTATFAGTGPLLATLRRTAKLIGADHKLEFLGKVNRERLRSLYQESDILVLPSLYEGMPAAVLEAMACGLPVVTTPVGGLSDLIRHGSTGILVPLRSPRRLASAIESLYNDRRTRSAIGHRAMSYARNRCDWKVVARETIGVYRKVSQEAG